MVSCLLRKVWFIKISNILWLKHRGMTPFYLAWVFPRYYSTQSWVGKNAWKYKNWYFGWSNCFSFVVAHHLAKCCFTTSVNMKNENLVPLQCCSWVKNMPHNPMIKWTKRIFNHLLNYAGECILRVSYVMLSRWISRKSNMSHFQFSIWFNSSLGEAHFAENPTWICPVVPRLWAMEGFAEQ